MNSIKHNLAMSATYREQAKDVTRHKQDRLLAALYAAKALGRVEAQRFADPEIKDIGPYLSEHAEILNSIYDSIGDLI
jgi:hypothetical protein